MMRIYLPAFLSIFIVSLISFAGALTLVFSEEKVRKALLILVGFSAGALLGDVFIHLLPEMVDDRGFSSLTGVQVIIGLLVFFVLEKFIIWHHCHSDSCQHHAQAIGKMNLIGDGLHNFIDGAVIAASFILSPALGWTTALAVGLHEIPQEIGDFGVLLHSGYTKGKALRYNFFSALFALLGAAAIFILPINLAPFLIPFTAGTFIYIAATDLMSELRKEPDRVKFFFQFLAVVAGIAVMMLLK